MVRRPYTVQQEQSVPARERTACAVVVCVVRFDVLILPEIRFRFFFRLDELRELDADDKAVDSVVLYDSFCGACPIPLFSAEL